MRAVDLGQLTLSAHPLLAVDASDNLQQLVLPRLLFGGRLQLLSLALGVPDDSAKHDSKLLGLYLCPVELGRMGIAG